MLESLQLRVVLQKTALLSYLIPALVATALCAMAMGWMMDRYSLLVFLKVVFTSSYQPWYMPAVLVGLTLLIFVVLASVWYVGLWLVVRAASRYGR